MSTSITAHDVVKTEVEITHYDHDDTGAYWFSSVTIKTWSKPSYPSDSPVVRSGSYTLHFHSREAVDSFIDAISAERQPA